MKNKWLRRIIGGLSFTTALFIFQACYGTPQDDLPEYHIQVKGKVVSSSNNTPIPDITVTDVVFGEKVITDQNGEFSYFRDESPSIKLLFTDEKLDDETNYFGTDTVIEDVYTDVNFEIQMDEWN